MVALCCCHADIEREKVDRYEVRSQGKVEGLQKVTSLVKVVVTANKVSS